MTCIHSLNWGSQLRATCVWGDGMGRSGGGVSVILFRSRKVSKATIIDVQGTSLPTSRTKITALLPGSLPQMITAPNLFLQRKYGRSQLVLKLRNHSSWICCPWPIQGLCSAHPRAPPSLPLPHPRNQHNLFWHQKP